MVLPLGDPSPALIIGSPPSGAPVTPNEGVYSDFLSLIKQNSWAFLSASQHTSAHVSTRQHTSAYVRIRQHTSAYVSICQHTQVAQGFVFELGWVMSFGQSTYQDKLVAEHKLQALLPRSNTASSFATWCSGREDTSTDIPEEKYQKTKPSQRLHFLTIYFLRPRWPL